MDAYFFSERWELGTVQWTFVPADATVTPWPGKYVFTRGHFGVRPYLLQLLTGS